MQDGKSYKTAGLLAPRASCGAQPAAFTAGLSQSPTKRCSDIALALLGLLFFAPLMLFVAVIVYAQTASVLFKQRRTGLGRREFLIYKFQTLTVSEDGDKLTQVSKGDARITPVGALLRSLSLDELPQLFNVLKGDMSIVGPRPHAIAHDYAFAELKPLYWSRYSVRPGITGLAQVNGARGEIRSLADLSRRIALDLLYVKQQSWTLDCTILGRTLLQIWRDEKAY
jgi:putative colanic acid biosynthesis UDP-glucose lipid carrier transferase